MLKRAVLLSLLLIMWLACGPGLASAQGVGQQVRADDLAALRAIDVPAVWPVTKGSGVIVAVIDTGANPDAPDLTGSVTVGPEGYNTTIGFGLINPDGALQEAGRLLKLRAAAAPGPAAIGQSARFGGGSRPAVIDAVHHAPIKLAGFSAAIVAGLVLLVLALLLARRWRRPPAVADGAPAATSELPVDEAR